MSVGDLIATREYRYGYDAPLIVKRLDHYLHSINRRPDWKWLRAHRILYENDLKPSRKLDGPYACMMLQNILQFLRSTPQSQTYADCYVLQERFPTLYRAYEIWSDRATPARWTLEANLLTKRDFLEISEHLRIPVPVIDMYCGVFFDVRGRLDNVGYIRDQVIQPAFHGQHGDVRERDYLWKLYAYYYGHHVLDAVISTVTNPVYCGFSNNVEQVFKDDVLSRGAMLASQAGKDLRLNDETRIQIIKTHAQYLAIKKEQGSEANQNSLMTSIYSLVQGMPLLFGSAARKEEFERRPYLQASYEVSPEQELQAALSGQVANIETKPARTFEQLIEENSATGRDSTR